MTTLNIVFENQTVTTYDNNGAHNAAKLIMNKSENMSIQFKTGKDGFPYAWLESKTVAGFKLILNKYELNWLMRYLVLGETEDHGTDPENVEAYQSEEKDLQLSIFKQMIEKGKTMQFVPRFRETNGYITAYASFKKGKVIFRLKETEELNEYLAEKDLI